MKRTRPLHRLAALAVAAGILLLSVIGCAMTGSGQPPAGAGTTIAGSSDPLQAGAHDDSSTVGNEPERRKTATPAPTSTPRPRRTPTATPTRAGPQRIDGLRVIYVDQLPREARTTLRLIEEGGPFPYNKDGSIFQNREGILPSRPRGYYRKFGLCRIELRDLANKGMIPGVTKSSW